MTFRTRWTISEYLDNNELIRQQGPWRGIKAVELATLKWVDGSTIAASWSLSVT